MPEPDAATPATDPCCNDGVFEVHTTHRVYTLRIDGCGDWRCEVDGVERSCIIGHGSLLLDLTDDIVGPRLQLSILECIGDAATGYYDGSPFAEVPVCRVDPR